MSTTDETFREVADLLFGGGADELVSKMNPAQSDLATRKKRERTQAKIGLATNVVGIGAGAAATPPALKAVGEKYKALKSKEVPYQPRHMTPTHPHKGGKLVGLKRMTGGKKAALAIAGGAAGLQVANLGGDFVANRVLARSAKKDPNVKGGTQTALRVARKKTRDTLNKSDTEIWNSASERKGKLTKAPMPQKRTRGGFTKKGGFKKLPNKMKTTNEVEKADTEVDVLWEGEIAKADGDKQQIFGWASVVEVNGEPVVDLQGDYISTEEMEKAAYSYVQKSREGGDMHLRDEWKAIKKSEMIESFIVTPEKRDAMGLPDSVPTGWWVGYQVQDPDVWAKIKSGERTGFSIHGHGRRSPAVS